MWKVRCRKVLSSNTLFPSPSPSHTFRIHWLGEDKGRDRSMKSSRLWVIGCGTQEERMRDKEATALPTVFHTQGFTLLASGSPSRSYVRSRDKVHLTSLPFHASLWKVGQEVRVPILVSVSTVKTQGSWESTSCTPGSPPSPTLSQAIHRLNLVIAWGRGRVGKDSTTWHTECQRMCQVLTVKEKLSPPPIHHHFPDPVRATLCAPPDLPLTFPWPTA